MSYYITANMTFEFEDKKKFNEIVDKAIELEWLLKDEDGEIYITDECGSIVTEKGMVVDENLLTVTIPNVYIRNGYSLIDILSNGSNYYGRVVSTDGNYEFSEFNDSNRYSYDSDDIFKDYGFEDKCPQNEDYKDDLDWENDWNDYMNEIDEIMSEWVNDY